jgi:polysaccharide export outer membrane protein
VAALHFRRIDNPSNTFELPNALSFRSEAVNMRKLAPAHSILVGCAVVLFVGGHPAAAAQGVPPRPAAMAAPSAAPASSVPTVTPPPDYVIGPDDQLSVLFWQTKDMSADVVVRPDGKISLPLLNDIQAAGLTPEQLRLNIGSQAKRFIQDPDATILVRQINSRKVFITGAVERPGPYPLIGPATVLQLIATAGGLKEYAESRKIVLMRNEGGRRVSYKFNYREVIEQKNIKQDIQLTPGDMVLVP